VKPFINLLKIGAPPVIPLLFTPFPFSAVHSTDGVKPFINLLKIGGLFYHTQDVYTAVCHMNDCSDQYANVIIEQMTEYVMVSLYIYISIYVSINIHLCVHHDLDLNISAI